MKTDYTEMFEFDRDFNTILMDDVDFIRLRTNLRVRVPIFMANIETGTPTIKKLATKGKMVFVSEVKPTISSNILQSQNYMTVKNLNSGQVDNYVNILKDRKLTMQNLDDGKISDYINIAKDIEHQKYIAKTGTNLKGRFNNNKISELSVEVTLSDVKLTTITESQPI